MGMDWTYWSRFPRSGLLDYRLEGNHDIGPAVFADSMRYPPLNQVGACMYGHSGSGNAFGLGGFGLNTGCGNPSYGFNGGFYPQQRGCYPPPGGCSDNVFEIIGDSVAAGWLSRGRGYC